MRSPTIVLTLLALLLVSAAVLHAQLDLTVHMTHSPGTFLRGGSGTYTIVVSNSSIEPAKPPKKPKGKNGDDDDDDDDDDSSAGLPTSASITVIDTLPLGLTSTGASGNGWNCSGGQIVSCTTSQVVASGSNATPITLTVSVAPNIPTPAVTNTVRVLGGGELSAQGDNNVSSDNTPLSATVNITTASLPRGTVGEEYSERLAVAGGQQPYTWNLASGSLGSLALQPNGTVSGMPASAGTLHFTARVTDKAGSTDEQSLSIAINPAALRITTASPLPQATLGSVYQRTFAASGGTTPYRDWNVTSGRLPTGLTLNAPNGVLSGTPTEQGEYRFTVAVRDSGGQTASKAFQLVALSPSVELTILTISCPQGPVQIAYVCSLQASGGVPEYTWSLGGGQLPPGVSLDSKTGTITGTPTAPGAFEMEIVVRDTVSATAARTMTITVVSDAAVTLNVAGDAAPGGQNQVTLVLSRAFPQSVTGEIALTFTPHAALPGNMDDPAIQFSTGGRIASFAVPQGSTQGRFNGGNLSLQLGTVAGTIKLTLTKMQVGNSDLTPSPAPTREIVIDRLAPAIREVRISNRTASGFTVEVVGFATSREVTLALFQFNPAPGETLTASQATIQLNQPAQSWYESQASRQFGSQFVYAQPFTVEGTASAVRSLVVTLSNSLGNSPSSIASF